MTLKAEPQKMTSLQTVVVLVVGASALLWGAFGLMDYNLIAEVFAGQQTLQTAAYAAVGGVGAVFLIEIFTENELLDILD
jgi:uncharacterized membrane protein YuzA (DUF378 family)